MYFIIPHPPHSPFTFTNPPSRSLNHCSASLDCFALVERISWKHDHSDDIVALEHGDSKSHHRKTTIKINGKTHFEHHTDHFKDGAPAHGDSAPRLCSPKCDCVLDANNKCVSDRLQKLGHLDGPSGEKTVNRYTKSKQEL